MSTLFVLLGSLVFVDFSLDGGAGFGDLVMYAVVFFSASLPRFVVLANVSCVKED
jgi:hypothetical protein|tara:strand:- start:16172 stop:16336 length:165 start_codon:yes stop_codon:yes gene_type:complete